MTERRGPFGLWMGMSPKDLASAPSEVEHGTYHYSTVPKPHSAFHAYDLHISPSLGLWGIRAISLPIQTSAYGTELHAAFSNLRQRLKAIYGADELIDGLMPDSIWDEPRDWMQALELRERRLLCEWRIDLGSTLADDLSSIVLSASALGGDSGFIFVSCSFANHLQARA